MNLKELSIATFNLFNLNEPGIPIYTDKDGWNDKEYDRKINWIAGQLNMLKADVFGFQELWNSKSIKNVLDTAGIADEYDLLAPPGTNGEKIVCSAIVKKGLLAGDPEWISEFPEYFMLESSGEDKQTPDITVKITGFSRPVLHFRINPHEKYPDVHVFVCHLKSKGPTKIDNEEWYKKDKNVYKNHKTELGAAISTIRRTSEAAAIRFILTDLMKKNDTPVIIMGDINDGTHSNTVNILTEQPKYLVGDSLGGGDVALYTVQTLQEYRDTRDVYYTYIHEDIRESLDHILVSQEFYDNSRKRIWMFNSMIVNNDHLNFEDHKGSGTNDHGIIRASFKFDPIKTNVD